MVIREFNESFAAQVQLQHLKYQIHIKDDKNYKAKNYFAENYFTLKGQIGKFRELLISYFLKHALLKVWLVGSSVEIPDILTF